MSSLQAVRNQYGGLFVAAENLPSAGFEQALCRSLEAWTQEGIKVVWMQIPAERAELIATAVRQGFEFHHCMPTQLMLTRRLRADALVPPFANHSIGAGAVVLSAQRELLVVLERGDAESRPGHYKLPGGMLERGEHIADGVVREVLEETGVRTEFQGLLSLRHHHRGQFGTSNIYTVSLLKPLSHDIAIDEIEIAHAMWVPVDDYLAREGIGLLNKRVVAAAVSARPFESIKIDGYMDSAGDYEIYLPAP